MTVSPAGAARRDPLRRQTVTLAVAAVRLALAAVIVVGVVVTFAETASRVPVNPFNFFGYFTIQSNLLMAAVWTWVAVLALRRAQVPAAADYARGAVTTYVVIVGLVYATLLAPLGAVGGVPVPWVNAVLHIIVPCAAAADWILIADRRALRWRLLPLVLVYPLIWLAVVLVRGATDGWFPYPFLNPANGYPLIAVYGVVIAATTLAIGAGVFAVSRVSLINTGPR